MRSSTPSTEIEALPFPPRWLNIKPSRFGSVSELFATYDYCVALDITMYGGGQFELSVGRGQIQTLASLFHADGPNDVAPLGYDGADRRARYAGQSAAAKWLNHGLSVEHDVAYISNTAYRVSRSGCTFIAESTQATGSASGAIKRAGARGFAAPDSRRRCWPWEPAACSVRRSSPEEATPPARRRSRCPSKLVAMPRVPEEIRGVHLTMGLASVEGKLGEYLALRAYGLNALELDVKDENGAIGFVSPNLPKLAHDVGAASIHYDAKSAAQAAEEAGIYLIGRVVVFADPTLGPARTELALQWPDGSAWRDPAGLAWLNPYDRRVWRYVVDVAAAAAKAGFDEIQFDYVRFPSDGDSRLDRLPQEPPRAEGADDRAFPRVRERSAAPARRPGLRGPLRPRRDARSRSRPVAEAAPSLSRRDLPDGLSVALRARRVPPDGSRGVPGPDGRGVASRLPEGGRRGTNVRIVPWLQDFSLSRTYGLDEVTDQVTAARRCQRERLHALEPARRLHAGSAVVALTHVRAAVLHTFLTARSTTAHSARPYFGRDAEDRRRLRASARARRARRLLPGEAGCAGRRLPRRQAGRGIVVVQRQGLRARPVRLGHRSTSRIRFRVTATFASSTSTRSAC